MTSNQKATDWQELTKLTQGQPILIERVRIPDKDIIVEGRFELPQLARLSQEDQVFITAFIRSHGSIKEMEQIFGVSYPTIKSRLNRICEQPGICRNEPSAVSSRGPGSAEARRDQRPGRDTGARGIEVKWRL